MRRALVLATALLALAASSAAWLGLASSAAPAPSAARPQQGESACTTEAGLALPGGPFAVGEAFPLTATARTSCPDAQVGPLHISLLIQASEEMARDPDTGEHLREDARNAAMELIEGLDLPGRPWIQVGITEYNDAVNGLCALTNDVEELEDCLGDLKASGDPHLSGAIQEAYNVLKRGRPRGDENPNLREMIVLVGDGTNDFVEPGRTPRAVTDPYVPTQAGCDAVVEEVQEVLDESPEMLIAAICVGGCDQLCLRQICSSPSLIVGTDTVARLSQWLDRLIADMISAAPTLQRLTLTLPLGPGMGYVEGSALPDPLSFEDGTLTWELQGAPAADVEILLELRPSEAGAQAVCEGAGGEIVDAGGATGSFAIDCPSVDVAPGEAPTETPEPATETPTATEPAPGETPTPTEPVPTATDEPGGGPTIYLPAAMKNAESQEG